MTTTNHKRPAVTLTDGALRAAIWKNQGPNGPIFSVTFSRSYKNAEGEYRDSTSFSGANLLKIAKLAERAYSEAAALRERYAIEGAAS